MITVSTDVQKNADKEDIASVTLTVTVAGPVDDYMLDGPSVIDLGGAEEYTVTAVDVNGGVPHIITGDGNDANDLVYVAVQPVTTLVTGLTASSQLKLDPETGMGSFTVYAALNAMHGDSRPHHRRPLRQPHDPEHLLRREPRPHGGHGHR